MGSAAGVLGNVGGGLLGGIIGGGGTPSSQRSDTSSNINLQDINALNQGRSELEATTAGSQNDLFKQLQALISSGPGQAHVTAGMEAQVGLADQLQAALAQGGLPNAMQQNQANQFAQSIFAPQQEQLNQQFNDQRIANQRLAGRMGRGGVDPVLQSKLAQYQGQQQSQLGAQRGAFAAQTAMNLPQIQLQLADQLAQVRGGLASQALQNRVSLLGMGQQLSQAERNYRLQAANRTGSSNTKGSSGGGQSQMLSGVMGGIGQFGSMFGDMFGAIGGGVAGIGAGATTVLPAVGGAAEIAGPSAVMLA